MRSGDTRKRSAEGLGTPIFTLGSLARSKARPFHSSRRNGMAADRFSFAISRSRRCSRNMLFRRKGEYHSIAEPDRRSFRWSGEFRPRLSIAPVFRRPSYTIEQARLDLQEDP